MSLVSRAKHWEGYLKWEQVNISHFKMKNKHGNPTTQKKHKWHKSQISLKKIYNKQNKFLKKAKMDASLGAHEKKKMIKICLRCIQMRCKEKARRSRWYTYRGVQGCCIYYGMARIKLTNLLINNVNHLAPRHTKDNYINIYLDGFLLFPFHFQVVLASVHWNISNSGYILVVCVSTVD